MTPLDPSAGRNMGSWSEPSIVQVEAEPAGPVRFSALVSFEHDVLFAGNRIPDFSREITSGVVAFSARINGKRLAVPESAGLFAYPILLPSQKSRARVVWAEPAGRIATIPPYGWPGVRFSALWVASLSLDGSRWVNSKRMFVGDLIVTESMWSSYVPLEGSRQMILALQIRPDRPITTIVVSDSGEQLGTIPGTEGAVYAVGTAHRQMVDVFYVASAGTEATSANRLYSVRSVDGGQSWGQRTLLSDLSANSVFEPNVVRRGNRVSIAWSEGDLSSGRVIRTAQSRDGGRTWDSPVSIPNITGFVTHPQQAIDAVGQIHLLFRSREVDTNRPTIRLTSRTWDSHWESPVNPFPELSVVGPRIYELHNGELALHFLGKPNGSESGSVSKLYMSRYR